LLQLLWAVLAIVVAFLLVTFALINVDLARGRPARFRWRLAHTFPRFHVTTYGAVNGRAGIPPGSTVYCTWAQWQGRCFFVRRSLTDAPHTHGSGLLALLRHRDGVIRLT
jgi:hypothetical protein